MPARESVTRWPQRNPKAMPAPTSKPPPLKRRATAASQKSAPPPWCRPQKLIPIRRKSNRINWHWHTPAFQIMPIARPRPIFLLSHQPGLHRIQMDVFQLLPKIPNPPNNHIEITVLPKWSFAFARLQNCVTRPGLKIAHDLDQIPIVRMQQKVNMRRHDYISKQKKFS